MLVGDMLRHNAKLRPRQVAVTFGDVSRTYEQLALRVHRVANALRALGVQPGDRVAVLSQNCIAYLELYFANAAIGAVTVPLNYRLTPVELEVIIDDSDAMMVVVADTFVPAIAAIRERLGKVRHYACIHAETVARPDGYLDYQSWTDAADCAAPPETAHENDLVWQMYTSGTTGRPKGAMITHRNLLTNVVQVNLALPMRSTARALIVAPLYHAAAVIVSMIALSQGATLVVKREFMPPEVLKSFEADRITHALLVPAMIQFLLNMPGIEKVNFASLEAVMYGASAIPFEVLKKALSVFKCDFVQGFGQTESVAVLTALLPEDHVLEGPGLSRLASCGRELFGTEVRIVDEQGREVPHGEVGEIVARGDQVMKGYWKLPEATAVALAGGWLHTGDLGRMDEDGYVYVVDRSKDMIVSGGENVYPREIEEVLFQHPAVADAAVIGVPSDEWGEEPKALIVLRPQHGSVTPAELMGFCEGKLAAYKRPKSIELVASLPRNPSGKVLKRELREPYWQGKNRRVN